MNKFTLPLSLIAVASLSACAGHQRVERTEPAYTSSYAVPVDGTALRAGSGRVAYLVDKDGPVNGVSTQRLTLHMTDGSTQEIVRTGQQVALGEHVRLRSDMTLRRDRYTSKAAD